MTMGFLFEILLELDDVIAEYIAVRCGIGWGHWNPVGAVVRREAIPIRSRYVVRS